MNDGLLNQLLRDAPFDKPMSTGARKLRDDVLLLCYSHINPNQTRDFLDHVESNYNRVNWEIAIFYHHNERIFEGILKKTSKKFLEDPKDKSSAPFAHQKGTKASGAARRKDIDWFELATFSDYSFWQEMIDYPREKLHINPSDIKKLDPAFTKMYELITGWLFTDFNFTSLYHIFEFARDYSLTFVSDCIEKVDDPRKRSTSYLQAVARQEMAVLKHELAEDTSLTEHSQNVINKMFEMVEKREDIDWDQIEDNAAQGEENRREFRKVKLS